MTTLSSDLNISSRDSFDLRRKDALNLLLIIFSPLLPLVLELGLRRGSWERPFCVLLALPVVETGELVVQTSLALNRVPAEGVVDVVEVVHLLFNALLLGLIRFLVLGDETELIVICTYELIGLHFYLLLVLIFVLGLRTQDVPDL